MRNILVIDVGTSSMRATLFSEQGEALKTFRSIYAPTFLDRGLVEQDPAIWADSLLRLTKESVQWAQEQGQSIEALALTSQRSSAIAVDSSGQPLHPAIMWQDTRTSAQCIAMQEHMAAVYSRTGLLISPVLAAPKFSWFKQQRPDLYKRAHKLITIADYLVFLITGRFVTDYTYGSRTLLMNLHTLTWDSELLQLFELDSDKLCELVPHGSIIGYTTENFRSATGLPSRIPLISAGGDQQCGALGTGVLNSGSIQITTGTGSYVIASSDQIHLDPDMKILCSVSAVPGRFILEASIPATAALYAWVGNTLYDRIDNADDLLNRLAGDAASTAVGANGVTMLPHFQGRGSPDWNSDASGMLANLTLATTRGDIVRSTLEGIGAEIAENLDELRTHLGGSCTILVSGGLSNLPLFNQIQADMFNTEISVPQNKETTSLGAWISASVALGLHASYAEALTHTQNGPSPSVYTPIPGNVEIYQQLRATRTRLYEALMQSGVYRMFRDSQTHTARK